MTNPFRKLVGPYCIAMVRFPAETGWAWVVGSQHIAVEKGNQKFVKLLLEYDVDTDRKDWDERTAREIARKRQRDEIVLLLQGA